MNKIILFISVFLISFGVLSLISELMVKFEIIFRIKMWWSIRNLIKALSNMYNYICSTFEDINSKSEEMAPEEIEKTKETLREYCKTLLSTIEQRTDKDNIAYAYFSSKNFEVLKKMSDDVKNILKMIN